MRELIRAIGAAVLSLFVALVLTQSIVTGVNQGANYLLLLLSGECGLLVLSFLAYLASQWLLAKAVGLEVSWGDLSHWTRRHQGTSLRIALARACAEAIRTVLVVPSSPDRLVRRWMVLAAGGLLSVLALVVGFTVLAAISPHPAPPSSLWRYLSFEPDGHWPALFAFGAGVNLLGLVLVGIPTGEEGERNDGGWLLDCLIAPQTAARDLALRRLWLEVLNGFRPRDWTPGLVALLWLGGRDVSRRDILAALFSYYHALDGGQIDLAERFLGWAVQERETSAASLWALAVAEAAYVEGFHRRAAEVARAWGLRLEGKVIEEQTRCRAEAAVLFAEGRLVESAQAAERGIAALMGTKDLAGVVPEWEWLDAIRRACGPVAPAAESSQDIQTGTTRSEDNILALPREEGGTSIRDR